MEKLAIFYKENYVTNNTGLNLMDNLGKIPRTENVVTNNLRNKDSSK